MDNCADAKYINHLCCVIADLIDAHVQDQDRIHKLEKDLDSLNNIVQFDSYDALELTHEVKGSYVTELVCTMRSSKSRLDELHNRVRELSHFLPKHIWLKFGDGSRGILLYGSDNDEAGIRALLSPWKKEMPAFQTMSTETFQRYSVY